MNIDDVPEPDLDAVQQLPDEGIRVPVRLDQPVPVHILPSRSGAARSYDVDTTTILPLLGRDDRRRRAQIISIDQHIFVGEAEEVRAGTAALWPKQVPLVIEHTELVFVRASASVTKVSVVAEQWAD